MNNRRGFGFCGPQQCKDFHLTCTEPVGEIEPMDSSGQRTDRPATPSVRVVAPITYATVK